jgi:hypothetical protein
MLNKVGFNKLYHIHVGKCAGSSINMALNKLGIKFTNLHCGNAPEQLKKIMSEDSGDNIYLVSARNPIDRFISAFNWDKYEKIIRKKSENLFWKKIYATFSSVDDLICSLYSSDLDRKKLAEFAINKSKLHIQCGLSWYIPITTLNKLPMERTVVINTEKLVDDFNSFLKFIESERPPLINSLPKDKDSSDFLDLIEIDNPKYLSSNAKIILEDILKEDFEILSFLNNKTISNK